MELVSRVDKKHFYLLIVSKKEYHNMEERKCLKSEMKKANTQVFFQKGNEFIRVQGQKMMIIKLSKMFVKT